MSCRKPDKKQNSIILFSPCINTAIKSLPCIFRKMFSLFPSPVYPSTNFQNIILHYSNRSRERSWEFRGHTQLMTWLRREASEGGGCAGSSRKGRIGVPPGRSRGPRGSGRWLPARTSAQVRRVRGRGCSWRWRRVRWLFRSFCAILRSWPPGTSQLVRSSRSRRVRPLMRPAPQAGKSRK